MVVRVMEAAASTVLAGKGQGGMHGALAAAQDFILHGVVRHWKPVERGENCSSGSAGQVLYPLTQRSFWGQMPVKPTEDASRPPDRCSSPTPAVQRLGNSSGNLPDFL